MEEKFRIRSFGRIKSRKLSDNKKNTIKNILPQYQIKIEKDKIINFPTNDKKNILEIGFGSGEQITNLSIKNENFNFIGCETYINGVISLIDKIKQNDIKNIQIFNNDARILLEKIPDNSLYEIFILFPDPWPKKKQNKRRIINEEFLKLIEKKLENNGVLFFASDIFNYVEWTYDIAKNIFSPLFNDFEQCKNDPDWWVKTKYQTKAIKAGRQCYFLRFKKR